MLKKFSISLFFVLLAPFFVGRVWGQVSMTGTTYSQNFNTAAAAVPTGWAFNETGTGANGSFSTGTGTGTAGDTYFLGTTNEWAFGSLLSGSVVPTIGVGFTNNTGSAILSIDVTYKGETWRIGSASRVDQLDFQYSLNATSITTGTWTDFNSLDYANPGQATGNGSQQHTSNISSSITGLNIANGSSFWFRWNDFNASGADDAMGIDDFSITLNLAAACTPNITLGSLTIPAGNITENTTNNVIYGFSLATAACAATLTGFNFTTTGTAVNSNFNNMKVWYSTDNNFGGDTQLGNSITTGMDAGNHILGGTINQTIAASTTGYIFITADLPCDATAGNTVAVDAITSSNLTFSTTPASYSGATSAGGLKTIVSNAPVNVTGASTSLCNNGTSTVSWTAAINCPDNYLVVAKAGSAVTLAPSGNGAAYTANALFGSGDAYDGGFVVYKNNGTSVNVTGLTNGTTYYFTIFTRKSTNWSSGVTVSCTPQQFNDLCTDALVLSPNGGSPTSGTFVGATSSGGAYAQAGKNDVWYKFTPICTGNHTITLSSFSNDKDFYVYTDCSSTAAITDATSTSATETDIFSYTAGTTYYIRVLDFTGSGGTFNIQITNVLSCCVPTHTVSSITPTSGPIGTVVTINGTGFTAGSTVTVGGVAATVQFVNSTQIKATINATTTTGSVVVTESACNALSQPTFTATQPSAGCTTASGTFTDLFISEVYDAASGNGFYIELYNPTASPISLVNYSIKINNNAEGTNWHGGGGGVNCDANSHLAAITVPANGMVVLNLGSSNSCPGSFTHDLSSLGFPGINADDDIQLLKNCAVVDIVTAPNNDGYTLSRLNSAVAPNSSFISGDWTINSSESCADLNNFNLPTFSPNISNLTDNSTCTTVDFSASATAGNSGALTYTWFFNDGVSVGWTQVTASAPSNLSVSGQTTDHLQISSGVANITSIVGYQFYCVVTENGTCTDLSNASTYNVSSDPYYRSVATGNWTTVANWEMSPNGSTGWTSACTYPTAANSDGIVIRNGHTITLDATLTEDNLTVDVGGTLTLLPNIQMTLNDGTGTDMTINGILIDNNNSSNSIVWNGTATWTLGTSATIIKTSGSSVINYRDKYEGGISTIPATANWIYRFTNNGNVIVTALNMYYPNLFFESTSGNHSWVGALEVLVGNSGTAVIKGNLSVGATGTGTVNVYNNNFNASPISVLGNVIIGAGSTLSNQDQSAASGSVGTGFDIKGNVTVATPGIYDLSYGTGTTTFSGTSLQTVSGAGTFKTYGFTLNNIAGASLNATDMEVTNNLTFQSANGANQSIIYTTGTSKVNITNNATTAIVNGVATSSTGRYIQGRLQWSLATGNTYTYPIGFAGHGAQGFTFSPTGNGNVLAYLQNRTQNLLYDYAYCDVATTTTGGGANIGTAGVNLTVGDGILDQIALDQHSPLEWEITQPSGSISQYDITVLATGAQALTLPPATSFVGPLRYLSKNGQPGNPTVPTTIAPDFTQTGFDLCPNNMTLTGMTSFSLFTLDAPSVNSVVILPVEMITFEGELIEPNTAELHWATASEINNDFFTLEHSMNGLNWEEIAQIDGAGNSTERIDYYRQHRYLQSGIHYYRLWSTDFDGTVYNRGIVALEVGDNGNAYYNSITQTIEMGKEGDYVIYSMDGKLVKESFHGKSIPFCCETGIYMIQNTTSGESTRLFIPKF